MTQFRLLTPRRAGWLAAAAVAVSAVAPLTVPALADANGGKTYTFTMATSGTPGVGESGAYTGTLTNTSDPGPGHQLGAADVAFSPSDAFFSLSPDSVSVSPSGAGLPTITYDSAGIHLRGLNAAPGAVITFAFHATALRGETVTWTSAAKQSNDFRGTNNSLTQSNTTPVVTSVSGSCGGLPSYDAFGCQGIPISRGGTVCTNHLNDQGQPSQVTACITLPPVPGAVGIQVIKIRTYLGGEGCPVSPVDCTWTTQVMSKLSTYYDAAHSASISVSCGSLCGTTAVYFQQNESTANPVTEPVLPCLSDLVPGTPQPASPISGSTVCVRPGPVFVNVTSDNDYKVMGIALA